ncbi:helix-turn-helix domain-containing protein [Streptomyces sp. H27-S2]|uniref:helix-turn-helix domain-containing protein n=1 Tax=Streptomyces antarcticus TaxID=2996458 RepID=UPI002271EE9D|nr:helix-turn-helix transcriptional regulator [Streptomyces sp. H27-S2]MCY0955047.1 helix-turn-helix transcriptional regulator [Streptomyces sp. H27-S2]
MGQKPNVLTPEASPLHRFGYQMRDLRERRNHTLRSLAEATFISYSKLWKWENAQRAPKHRSEVEQLDRLLDGQGLLVELWARIGRDASSLCDVSVPGGHVSESSPGLALAVSGRAGSNDDDTDTVVVPCRVHGRILFVPVPRRVVLASGLAALATTALPAPTATAAATAADMTSPIDHFSQLRRVMIQTDNLIGPRNVLPALQQHLARLTSRRRASRGADAAELLALETRYEELAGWLAQDIGDERTAHGHTAKALDASHITGNTDLTAYILGRKAQLAVDTGLAADALGLAAAARRTARPGSRLEVIAVMHQAHAHAVLGDGTEALTSYDTALALLGRADTDGVWGSWLDEAYVSTARARSLAALGEYEQAAAGFDTAIAALPTTYRRDRGVYLARAARAHAGAGNLPLAAQIGLQAVGIAAETGSARIVSQLDRLDRVLAAAGSKEGIAEFRAALDQIVLHPA